MQNTSADYKLEINKPSRSFECKATIGNNIYTNEDIVDIILDYPQSSDGFTIGNTISQTLDLTLINKRDVIYSTSQVKVEIGLKIGSKIEYILMGYYNIDDIEKTDYTTKLTCYDNMIKFETPYFSELRDNPTLQQVVNELSKITGIQFEGSLPAYTVSKLGGFSCREVLSYVASICGGNALITRNGNFTIKGLSEVSKTINGDNYFEFKTEEVKYKIGKISCQVDENNVLSKGALGIDSMELSFENPWITENILTDIYNKLNGLSYLGYSMKWQGDLSLDPYDIIAVTDVKNVTRKMPILSQKLTYTGGLTSEIEAKGESKNKNSFSSSGSTTNKVNRLVTEQAIIKEALIDKANIKDLEAVSIKTQTLEAKTAKIEEAIIDVAHIEDLNAINVNIENLKAADATINNALIRKADITQLNAVQGNINTLNSQVADIQTLVNGNLTSDNIQSLVLTANKVTVADGFIKNAMIDNLDVSKINAGTISTDKFLIKSNDGGIEINGSTQQFKDSKNRVRLQLGKDSKGDFNFILRGEDGTSVLLDHTGLKAKAITDGLIVNNMLGQGAVTGDKVNIGSLIQEVNKDSNTSTIKATKIQLDKEGQSLDIAFNTLKTNVDNIQVGGRNLITNSSFAQNLDTWTSSLNDGTIGLVSDATLNRKVLKITRTNYDGNSRCYISKNAGFKVKNGDTITISATVKSENLSHFNNNEIMLRVNGAGDKPSVYIDKNLGEWVRLSATYTYTLSTPTDVAVFVLLGRNGTIYVADLKVERGNKATDWTPAPEDIENRIESNTTQITAQQGKIEALISDTSIVEDGTTKKLKDAYANLKLTVNGLNSTIGSHTTNITNLQGQMSTANSNISNLSGKVQTVESKQVSFEQNLSGISQKVSSAESNIVTLKGQMTTANNNIASANNKIDNLQIGGRNLVLNSNDEKTYAKDGSIIVTKANNFIKVLKNTSSTTSNLGVWKDVVVEPNTEYTVSLKVGHSDIGAIGIGSFISGNNVWWHYLQDKLTPNQFYSKTITTKTNETKLRIFIAVNFNSPINSYLEFINLKLEKANKATDWSPAPEDIESDINSVDSKVTTTNNKVSSIESTVNGISSKVTSLESTTSTINGNVTNLQQRMSTAESKITSNAIINTVSSTINAAKQEAINSANSNTANQLKNYATTSTLTQTVDSITAKFTSNGGHNLIKNGKAKNGTYGWINNGGGIHDVLDGKFGTCFGTAAPSGIAHEFIKLKNDTNYVYEAYIYSKQVIIGSAVAPLHFWCSTTQGAGQAQATIVSYRQQVGAINTWTKCYVHFKTKPTGDVWFRPFIYVGGSAAFDLWVTEISLTESKVETAWTPHPSEIYEGSTVIDASGVTVNNGALRVNNKAGQTVLSGDSNGNLIYKGKMRQEASNGNYAELYPLEINNGHISYQMWLGSAQSDFRIKWDGGNEMAYFGAGGFQTDNYMTLRCLSDNNKTLYFEKGTIRPATGNYGQLGTEGYYFNKVNTASVGRDRTAGKHLNVDAGTVFLRSSYGVDWNDGGVIASAAGYFRPYSNLAWALGSPNERWSTVYANAVNYPSDLTLKENIKYLLRDEVQIIPFSVKSSIADITTQELYDFIKEELYLAEFNYKVPEYRKDEKSDSIGFIAQDIKGSKVGNKLLKDNNGILSYDSATYISVIAGALQKAIEKIEILENKIKVSI